MADVNMISAGSPIWVVIFARIFLKERLLVFDIINIFITLLGIVFIIKPPFIFGYDLSFELDHEYYVAGIVVFLGSVILQSNVYIILRLLKDVHFSVTLFMFGSIGALESSSVEQMQKKTKPQTINIFCSFLDDAWSPLCPCVRSRQSNDSGHRAPLIYWSVVIIKSQDYDPVSSAQVLLTVSLQIEEAVKVSITRKAGDILFAFMFQIFIFNVSTFIHRVLQYPIYLFQNLPGMWSIVGASLVAGAVLISSAKKIVDSLPENHVMKTTYLKCFYTKDSQDSVRSEKGAEEENCLKR